VPRSAHCICHSPDAADHHDVATSRADGETNKHWPSVSTILDALVSGADRKA
jgi:hypothetical protein